MFALRKKNNDIASSSYSFCRAIFRRFCTSETRRTQTLSYSSYQDVNAQGNDCPIVILHGLFGSKNNWHGIAKMLSKKGRKVLSVDARNHGESFHSANIDYEVMSDDLVWFLSDQKIEKAVFIGHSMGGKTAMMLSLRKPDLVDRLIVVDVAPDSSPSATVFPVYAAAMQNVYISPGWSLAETRHEADKQLLQAIPNTTVRQFVLTNLTEKDGIIQWRVNLQAILANFDKLVGFPKIFTQFHRPTLFLGGSNSSYIRKINLTEIERLFPSGEVDYIDGAGHWVHAEKPQEFLLVVQKFLEKTKKTL